MAREHDTVVTWLKDAHAMESAAVSNIEKNIDRFKTYPEVQQTFQQDLAETRRNVQQIEGFLDRLGADRSALKDLGMKFAGAVQPYLGAVSGDEPVKHMLAAHAYENFEVASFHSLTAAAEQMGDAEIRDACQRSMSEKKRIADALDRQIPLVTRQYLSRKH